MSTGGHGVQHQPAELLATDLSTDISELADQTIELLVLRIRHSQGSHQVKHRLARPRGHNAQIGERGRDGVLAARPLEEAQGLLQVPADWPRYHAREVFTELDEALRPLAPQRLRELLGSGHAVTPLTATCDLQGSALDRSDPRRRRAPRWIAHRP